MDKALGKISRVSYGSGGHDGAMFGLSVTLSTDIGSVDDFKGWWTSYPAHAKYTKQDWEQAHLKATLEIMELLKQSKKSDVRQLEGVPVEVTFDGMTLKSWRILTEVL